MRYSLVAEAGQEKFWRIEAVNSQHYFQRFNATVAWNQNAPNLLSAV
jgi:hypothetical protein